MKWEKGSTVTFNVYRTTSYSGATYSSGSWGDYTSTNTSQIASSMIYANMEDYLISNPNGYFMRDRELE